MTNILRFVCGSTLAGVIAVAAACNMDVTNPSVIDAGTFDPTADGTTLALSAQTNFYQAFQNIAVFGGLISDELWNGAVRFQANRIAARNFVAADDMNRDFFAILSVAVAANENAVNALGKGADAASDVNYARVSMNLGFSVEIMAETMCSGVIQGGPELSDTQLLDTAVTNFTRAVSIGTAAGGAGTDIVNASNVGLARTYLQLGDWDNASATAALVPSDFVENVLTTADATSRTVLGNQFYSYTLIKQILAPERYRISDSRLQVDSSAANTTENGLNNAAQAKYTGYADPIRLVSGLEARYIVAEAALHGSGDTGPALALIAERRAAGGQSAYSGGSDVTSVLTELLNQGARDFWLEGKKLGDLRRNPTVSLAAVLTDPNGAPFYTAAGGDTFGSNFCVPIPPEETNSNPNF